MILDAFFSPKSIAIVGVSRNKDKVGHNILTNLLESGYKGKISLVNPWATKILGIKVFKSVNDIQNKIELAVIVVPAKEVLDIVLDCAQKGIKNLVIISAGFSEIGSSGLSKEIKLKNIVDKYKLNVLGPNCLGFVNNKSKTNVSFSASSNLKGDIAFVSQSGAIGTAFLDWAKSYKIGLSYFVSLGNKVGISENDILKVLAKDKTIKTILFYLEDFTNGNEFIKIANQVTNKKNIIILKPGISLLAQKAISSHTGALATNDLIVNAGLKQAGCIRVDNIEQLFAVTKILAWQGLPKSKKTIVLTNAGGVGITAIDDLVKANLEPIKTDSELVKQLNKFLPKEGSKNNPIDLLGDALAVRYQKALKIIGKSDNIDIILVLLTPQKLTQSVETARFLNEFSKTSKKCVIACFIGGKSIKTAIDYLNNQQIPVFNFPNDATEALGKIVNSLEGKSEFDNKKLLKVNLELEKYKNKGMIPFAHADNLLQKYNIQRLKSFVVDNSNELKNQQVSFPVVCKIIHPNLIHKTELSAVRLNIKSFIELQKTLTKLEKVAVKNNLFNSKFQIQEQVADKIEVIIGIKKDNGESFFYNEQEYIKSKGFGHTLVFGSGGIYAEVYKDFSLRVLPINKAEIQNMISSTKIGQILQGARGKSFDYSSTVKLIENLVRLIAENNNINELDINPAFVTKNGTYVADVKIMV